WLSLWEKIGRRRRRATAPADALAWGDAPRPPLRRALARRLRARPPAGARGGGRAAGGVRARARPTARGGAALAELRRLRAGGLPPRAVARRRTARRRRPVRRLGAGAPGRRRRPATISDGVAFRPARAPLLGPEADRLARPARRGTRARALPAA